MELHEYPRPANDTGIGIHWSAGYATAIGLNKIRQFWIPEMKALGVKWVKIFNHEGAHDFAELLLAEGFMPIVRIYRAHPNPGRLSVKELVDVEAFVRLGVRYFECNNEPDRDTEWKGGRVPANGLDIAVEDAMADMEAILERGGMPAVPAVSCGSRWDLVGKMVEKGRRDLFDGPVWQALHNYSRNRPLDYPYDLGNQEGASYTQRFYQTVRNECPGFDPWYGRSLAQINQMRRDYANPGATARDDTMCWLAYEYFDARNQRHIGHSIPLLSTENGYLVGEQIDPRYPATTPDLHLAQTLEACRIMMGSSRRFQPAPDYYFCTAFMLIANEQLGSSSHWWEGHAWYSRRWPGGVLPIVKALRAEPKALRRWQQRQPVGTRILLHGTVHNTGARDLAGLEIVLDRNGLEQARVTVDNFGRYAFPDLLPGSYILRIPDVDFMESVSLTPEQREFVLNLTLPTVESGPSRSVVHGLVRGGAGAVVLLLRTDDGEEWVTTAHDDGSYRFVDLAAGTYRARVYPRGAQSEPITLDGENSADIELGVDGWGYTVEYDPDPALSSASEEQSSHPSPVVRCAVEGHKNVNVFVQSGAFDWQSAPAETGSAPELGEFACEIEIGELLQQAVDAPAASADYAQQEALELDCTVRVEGVVDADGEPEPLRAPILLRGGQTPFICFVHQRVPTTDAPAQSIITGRVLGEYDPADPVYVVLTDAQAHQQRQAVDETGAFTFDHLADGLYSVVVEGHAETASRSDIALDGENQIHVELVLPPPVLHPAVTDMQQSIIAARVPNGAGRTAKLSDELGNTRVQIVNKDDVVRFSELPAGRYALTVESGHRHDGLDVNGSNGCEVLFAPLATTWQAEVSAAQPMPGFSAIRVEVAGEADRLVHLSKEDWEGRVARTGSRPDLGDYALEFSPLDPGYYLVEPDQLGIIAEVHLTELEAVWVTFWQQTAPISPATVRPLDAIPHEHAVNQTSVTDADGTAPVSLNQSKKTEEMAPDTAHIAPDTVDKPDATGSESAASDAASPIAHVKEAPPQEDEQAEPGATAFVPTRDSFRDAATPESVSDRPLEESPNETQTDGSSESTSSNKSSNSLSNGSLDARAAMEDSRLAGEHIDPLPAAHSAQHPPPLDTQEAGKTHESLTNVSAAASIDQSDVDPPDTEETKVPAADSTDTNHVQRPVVAPETTSAPVRYLYIGAGDAAESAQTIEDLIAVLRFVAQLQPAIGNDMDEAMQADHVIIVGDAPAEMLTALTARGIDVEQVSDNLIEAFRRLDIFPRQS